MEQDSISLADKNKQRISMMQLKIWFILPIGAGTIALIQRIFKDPNVLNSILATLGCVVTIILVFLFVKSYSKSQKIIK